MKLKLLLLAVLLPLAAAAKVSVAGLLTEGLESPLGLDTDRPRFSWKTVSDEQGVVQTAYEIEVATSAGRLESGKADLWRSGRVESARQLWVAYGGKQLRSGTRACWRVRVITNRGTSEWSRPQEFGVGLLCETGWRGRWIGIERLLPGERRGLRTRLAARYLRREFSLEKKPVSRATARSAIMGMV